MIQRFRTIFFLISGIGIIVFHQFFDHYIPFLVGGIMIIYGLDGVILLLVEQKIKENLYNFIWCLTQMLLGLVMILILNDKESLEKCCIIWATWTILRETREIEEVVMHYQKKKPYILNAIESFLAIFLALFLIYEPLEHYPLHVVFLGVEVIGYVFYPLLITIHEKRTKKKITKK